MLLRDFKLNQGLKKNLYKKKGAIYCTSDSEILFPVRYEKSGLASLKTETSFLGVCMLVVGKVYMKLFIPVYLTSDPYSIKIVQLDGVEYYQLIFKKDEPMFKTSLVMNNEFIHKVTKENIINGNVPLFMDDDDLNIVFDNLDKYTGSSVFSPSIKSELFIAAMTRKHNSPRTYYRTNATGPIKWVGFRDKNYGHNNNISRLSSAYLANNLNTAINTTPTEQTELEKQLLR